MANQLLNECDRDLLAALNFSDPTQDPGVVNDAYRNDMLLNLNTHDVVIHNARASNERLSLDTNGFLLCHRPSNAGDISDLEIIRSAYYPEVAQLIRDLTGADHVATFGEAVRGKVRIAGASSDARVPVKNAHIDYDLETVRAVAARHAPAGIGDYGCALINVWRPIRRIESDPLAVADARTIASKDLLLAPIHYSRAGGESDMYALNLAYSPAQKWYYFPDMTPEEALVFRIADTRRPKEAGVAHTSFDLPQTPVGAAPRMSVEIRTVAYFLRQNKR